MSKKRGDTLVIGPNGGLVPKELVQAAPAKKLRWPEPSSMPKDKLVGILMRLQGILWAGKGSEEPDPDKEWDHGTLEEVAYAMEALKPK